ncbi:hypothetical protein Hanom_Chr15g01342941 [Helianthus anomalus]
MWQPSQHCGVEKKARGGTWRGRGIKIKKEKRNKHQPIKTNLNYTHQSRASTTSPKQLPLHRWNSSRPFPHASHNVVYGVVVWRGCDFHANTVWS